MDRQTLQMIVTKLDTKAITLKEAKAFAVRVGFKVQSRTKEAFIKEISKQVK